MSFTGRFSQYIGVRSSSPVVSKRFNPKLFFRLEKDKDNYIDLEYAHESNGQRISRLKSYNSLADDLDRRVHANDYISRGWDYGGATVKYKPVEYFHLFVSYAEYIDGVMQGSVEEYYSEWEPARKITARNEVSGLRLFAKIEGKGYSCKPAFMDIDVHLFKNPALGVSFRNGNKTYYDIQYV